MHSIDVVSGLKVNTRHLEMSVTRGRNLDSFCFWCVGKRWSHCPFWSHWHCIVDSSILFLVWKCTTFIHCPSAQTTQTRALDLLLLCHPAYYNGVYFAMLIVSTWMRLWRGIFYSMWDRMKMTPQEKSGLLFPPRVHTEYYPKEKLLWEILNWMLLIGKYPSSIGFTYHYGGQVAHSNRRQWHRHPLSAWAAKNHTWICWCVNLCGVRHVLDDGSAANVGLE